MSEQNLEVFNVINYLKDGNEVETVLNEGEFASFPSAEDCISFMVEEGYLEGEFKATKKVDAGEQLTAEEISKKYTVAELKDILRENGLKVSGKKQELIERVMPVLNGEDSQDKVTGSLDDFNKSNDLKLTEKAFEYLKENDWMDLYMYALVAFRFEDYETYVAGSTADKIETALKFCDEILSRALIRNQFLVFIDALSAKAHVYAYNQDYESFLDYDLQRYILGLNPIVMDAQTLATYDVINKNNVINIRSVVKTLKMGSLKKRFDKIWAKSHIKSTTVPKKTCYKILQKIIDGTDIEELNFDVKEKYFSKKYGI